MSWISENQTENLKLSFRIKKRLLKTRSKLQLIEVYDTYEYGKLLLLDRKVMLTERDEFIYHEMIVHPTMGMTNARNILVIGGGDGGTVRELLKYAVNSITIVEIDEKVIEIAKKFFPEMTKTLNDKRVNIIIDDGAKYVSTSEKKYDLIISDSTDPIGPGKVLFEENYVEAISRISNVFVSQSESPLFHRDLIKKYHSIIKKYFKNLLFYFVPIPTYPSGIWSFTVGLNIDIKKPDNKSQKFYSPPLFEGLTHTPEAFKIK